MEVCPEYLSNAEAIGLPKKVNMELKVTLSIILSWFLVKHGTKFVSTFYIMFVRWNHTSRSTRKK